MCGSPAIDARLREDAKKEIMVFSADDLVGWSDFPKGLRVLLLHQDGPSATDIKSKLQEMDYIVSLFCDENEALEAISVNAESFHVALVEVTTGNNHWHFRFLEMARGVSTIMISNDHCLSTMMKCIAHGATEFLEKPISEEKLRNIWQHVVRKAFNAGGSALSKSLKPIKETVVSMLGLNSDSDGIQNPNSSEVQHAGKHHESGLKDSLPNDRFPAPSTPQLEQGGRLMDDGDCQEQPNSSMEESKEHAQESVEAREFISNLRTNDKSCNNLNEKFHEDESASTRTGLAAEEVDSAEGSKTEECSTFKKESFLSSSHLDNGGHIDSNAKGKKASIHHSSHTYANRAKKKKMKVDWTPELHRQFIKAVEKLGIEQAIPSKILELMKVEGLTRHNVASHLQKYRVQRRHILPKDEERRWQQQQQQQQQHRDPWLRGYIHKPHVGFPPIHSNFSVLPSQAYPVWSHPSYHPSSIPIWDHTGFPTWQPSPDIWPWKTYPKMHADAWGFPVVPTESQLLNLPQNLPQSHDLNSVDYEYGESRHYHNLHPAEEVVDKMVKEAISKPWLPLPLGLKPPSMDSVLAELHIQGISNIPSLNSTSSSSPSTITGEVAENNPNQRQHPYANPPPAIKLLPRTLMYNF